MGYLPYPILLLAPFQHPVWRLKRLRGDIERVVMYCLRSAFAFTNDSKMEFRSRRECTQGDYDDGAQFDGQAQLHFFKSGCHFFKPGFHFLARVIDVALDCHVYECMRIAHGSRESLGLWRRNAGSLQGFDELQGIEWDTCHVQSSCWHQLSTRHEG